MITHDSSYIGHFSFDMKEGVGTYILKKKRRRPEDDSEAEEFYYKYEGEWKEDKVRLCKLLTQIISRNMDGVC